MKKLIIFTSPIVLFVEIYILKTILELVSAKNDTEVLLAILLLCAFAYGNFELIKFILKTFKTKEK